MPWKSNMICAYDITIPPTTKVDLRYGVPKLPPFGLQVLQIGLALILGCGNPELV